MCFNESLLRHLRWLNSKSLWRPSWGQRVLADRDISENCKLCTLAREKWAWICYGKPRRSPASPRLDTGLPKSLLNRKRKARQPGSLNSFLIRLRWHSLFVSV